MVFNQHILSAHNSV